MSVKIDPNYLKALQESGAPAPETKGVPPTPIGETEELLKQMREVEMRKTRLDARAPVPRLDEIEKLFGELGRGEVGGAKKFLKKEAQKEQNYLLTDTEMEKLGDELAVARVEFDEANRELRELDEARKEGKISEVPDLEVKVLEARGKVQTLETIQADRKASIEKIQNLLNLAEKLGE